MEKKRVIAVISCVAVGLLPIVAGLLMLERLPEKLPIHYNVEGVEDQYAGRMTAVLLLPIICVVLTIFLALISNRPTMGNFKLFLTVAAIGPMLSLSIQSVILMTGLEKDADVSIAFIVIGIVFIACGNYIPTVRPNSIIGVRYPWIMDDEEAWTKTQRVGGKIMFFFGILVTLQAITKLGGVNAMVIFLLGGTILLVIITAIYSYAAART